MKYTLLVAAAFVAAPTSVMAQDSSTGGLHVSAVAGWESLGATVDYEDTAFPQDNFKGSESDDGLVYGINAGYDFPLGSASIGPEFGVEWSDNKGCGEIFGGDELCGGVRRNLYAGIRGTTQLASRTALTAGLGYVNGSARVSYTDPAAPADNFSETEDRDGYRLSLGVEQRLSNNLFFDVEYRYLDYKDVVVAEGTESVTLGIHRHQVVAGLGVRF